jgi:hypothetical protein
MRGGCVYCNATILFKLSNVTNLFKLSMAGINIFLFAQTSSAEIPEQLAMHATDCSNSVKETEHDPLFTTIARKQTYQGEQTL